MDRKGNYQCRKQSSEALGNDIIVKGLNIELEHKSHVKSPKISGKYFQ